jgi:hypothetical protein
MALIIMFASTISWIFLTIDQNNLEKLGSVFLFVLLAFVIIGLAAFFYIFGDYLKQRRGIAGLIINFVFFIPCMLLDFIEFMKREFNLTTRTEYILLISELLLIICYFFAIPIINGALSSGTIYLLKAPVFLNKKTVLLEDTTKLALQTGAHKSIYTGNTNKSITGTPVSDYLDVIDASAHLYSSNFSISMWVYLNVQTREFLTNAGKSYEVEIFSYGNGKPKITYTNDSSDINNRDKYNFYFTDSSSTANYQTSLPGQKWNNIVFNYSSNKVDLFINGNLETTFSFDAKNRVPVYLDTDTIVTGQQHQGLYGAICNIVYYKNSLQNNQIVNDYNFLMLKNPPIAQI